MTERRGTCEYPSPRVRINRWKISLLYILRLLRCGNICRASLGLINEQKVSHAGTPGSVRCRSCGTFQRTVSSRLPPEKATRIDGDTVGGNLSVRFRESCFSLTRVPAPSPERTSGIGQLRNVTEKSRDFPRDELCIISDVSPAPFPECVVRNAVPNSFSRNYINIAFRESL